MTSTTTLIEALPYIREFRGQVFVVRCAPSLTGERLEALARDVAMLRFVGVKVVVVHPHEARGDGEDTGRPRPTHRLVHEIGKYVPSTGMSGADGAPRWLISLDEDGDSVVDADLVRHVIDDYTPVVEAVAVDRGGEPRLTDPDLAAARLAIELDAYKAIFIVGDRRVAIEGEGEISEMRVTDDVVARVVADADLDDSLGAARLAIDSGAVRFAHLVPNNASHAILLELFTDSGFGTKLRSDEEWSAAMSENSAFPPSGYVCW